MCSNVQLWVLCAGGFLAMLVLLLYVAGLLVDIASNVVELLRKRR